MSRVRSARITRLFTAVAVVAVTVGSTFIAPVVFAADCVLPPDVVAAAKMVGAVEYAAFGLLRLPRSDILNQILASSSVVAPPVGVTPALLADCGIAL